MTMYYVQLWGPWPTPAMRQTAQRTPQAAAMFLLSDFPEEKEACHMTARKYSVCQVQIGRN